MYKKITHELFFDISDSNVQTSHLYALYANLRRTRVRNFRTEPQSTVPDLTSRGIVDVFVTDITVNGNIYMSVQTTRMSATVFKSRYDYQLLWP